MARASCSSTSASFPVHRESADREALQRAEEVLKRGEVLVLFPEGTRREGPEIEDLMEGAAFLSARTGAPIVPIGIGGSDLSMPKGSAIPKPYDHSGRHRPRHPSSGPYRGRTGLTLGRPRRHRGTGRETPSGLRRGQSQDRAVLSMCGIVGCVGYRNSVPMVLDGLARLEYRGYDSAGMAVIDDGRLRIHKVKGKINELRATTPADFAGTVGIGHTRWATHGVPNEVNAHPHTDPSGRIAVVHNGIIDNAQVIKDSLLAQGYTFRSDTDSEVLAHLIALSDAPTLAEAVREALGAIEGTYGIAVVDLENPDQIVAARNGSPVVIGIGENEHFVASDVGALILHTQKIAYLDDGEIAVLERDQFRTMSIEGRGAHQGRRDRRLERRHLREGRARALPAQGDLRTARRRAAHALGSARAPLRHGAPRRHRAQRPGDPAHPARADPRLWLRLLRRSGRGPSHRAHGADPGRRRAGLGVPLPQSHH